MPKVKITLKKKVVIGLDVSAVSPYLNETELREVVEKDLFSTVYERFKTFGGACGCANEGKSFGYEFENFGIVMEDG